jgi:outer membrane protein OmpA-like peptidoglycan-associated protein
MAACSTTSSPTQQPTQGYFGAHGALQRSAAHTAAIVTRPNLDTRLFVVATPKALQTEADTHVASYFDDHSFSLAPPIARKETAGLARVKAPTASRLEFNELLAPLPDLSQFRAELTASLASLPASAEPSKPPVADPSTSVALAEMVDSSHFLISFANGSHRVSENAAKQAKALAELLPPDTEIRLRGRVGNRLLSSKDAQLAMSRALAVKSQLVAAGLPANQIKILMPRDNDILNAKQFDSPANMSVSILLDQRTASAVASRLSSSPRRA